MPTPAVLDGPCAPFLTSPRLLNKGEGPAAPAPAGQTPCPLCELRSPERPPLRFAVSCLEHWLDLNA